nr:MAG TPA: hypothetical protein [Caudoviricetes sp.]
MRRQPCTRTSRSSDRSKFSLAPKRITKVPDED